MYGIDLRAALYGEDRIGLRRCYQLVRYLPPGSATWVAVHGQQAVWSTDNELAALMVEVVHHQTRVLARLLGAKQDLEAIRIPRPDSATEPRDDVQRLSTTEDVARFLGLTEKE